jgi:D-inositol-3-phosphate glycosyltransferase
VLVAGKMKPNEEAEHRHFVETHGLGERVRFDIGHVSDAALPSYYRAADVVALPYLRIYESAVALMAMSLERPVIASDLPPLREVVGEDSRGMLFPVGDAAALANQIGALLQSPERRDTMAKNAARYAAGARHWSVTGTMLSRTADDLSKIS